MADNTQSPQDEELVIPEQTLAQYPQLVQDIKASESMDNKERNYWLQVLPVMNEEQINELKDILSTEKEKLAEIEKKYAKGGAEKKPEKTPEELEKEEEERRKFRLEQKAKEEKARSEENIDDILSQLDDL